MKKFKIEITLVLVCFVAGYFPLLAQQQTSTKLKEFSIGDTIDLSAYPVKNLDEAETHPNLGHYKGKWLIIDFWATYCQACIVSMPKLNNLKEEFRDDLNIIFVTSETRSRVNSFLAHSELTKGNKLPFIVEDATYKNIFPHRFIPHQVWIDPDGVVRAITGYEDLTEENLRAMMSGSKQGLVVKTESEPWSSNINYVRTKMEEKALYKSVLSRYNPSFPSTGFYNRNPNDFHKVNHVSYFNYSAISMFYSAMMHLKDTALVGNVNPHRIILDVKDSVIMKRFANQNLTIPFYPTKFPYMGWANNSDFRVDHSFNYELTLPEFVDDSVTLFNLVMDDLNRFFPIKGRIEKRLVNSLIIVVKDSANVKKLLRPLVDEKSRFVTTDEDIGVRKRRMSDFVLRMKSFRALPIIDETGIDFPVSMVITFKDSPFLDKRQGLVSNMLTFDEEVFRKELNKYGLDILKEKRWVDMLIISD